MRATILLIISIFGIQILYSQSTEEYFDESIKVDKDNVPIDNSQQYFPLELFPEYDMKVSMIADSITRIEFEIIENEFDTFVVDWYSKHLFALNEPLLFNRSIKNEVYRFTWLRTFDSPILIRIEKENDDYRLVCKLSDGAGGYDPGKLKVNKSKKLTRKDWGKFIRLLQDCDFWNLELGRKSIGLDGSEWILEGNNGKSYRVVSEWSPDEGAFYELCNFLIELSNLRIKKRDKY